MTQLELTDRESTPEKAGINWDRILMVTLAIAGWLFAGASGAFGDYRKLGDRVTTLETNRQNDINRLERIENKIDRLIERPTR